MLDLVPGFPLSRRVLPNLCVSAPAWLLWILWTVLCMRLKFLVGVQLLSICFCGYALFSKSSLNNLLLSLQWTRVPKSTLQSLFWVLQSNSKCSKPKNFKKEKKEMCFSIPQPRKLHLVNIYHACILVISFFMEKHWFFLNSFVMKCDSLLSFTFYCGKKYVKQSWLPKDFAQ